MLKKAYRLLPKADFERVYNSGKKVKGEFGMLIYLEDKNLTNPEFGIVVSKKIGKANKRNKFKRRVRAVIGNLINEGFFTNRKGKITYIAFKEPSEFKPLKTELLKQFNEIFK
jgi:RNase P protein component